MARTTGRMRLWPGIRPTLFLSDQTPEFRNPGIEAGFAFEAMELLPQRGSLGRRRADTGPPLQVSDGAWQRPPGCSDDFAIGSRSHSKCRDCRLLPGKFPGKRSDLRLSLDPQSCQVRAVAF
ncbi:hypothetical protein [Rhizobium mayense]|uniref:Transposase n=1 Tax=Rhizobium mayense TaxID=1312184 RepID=A0ABT7K591_9HYPH|nr:hypothetical protein [Rhizobium mayense]MDL2403145.1 hypothetical protein [Rhizobium mayense]